MTWDLNGGQLGQVGLQGRGGNWGEQKPVIHGTQG